MLTRLLDTLLPAIVLVALVFAMASGFGVLSQTAAPRVVSLERVVVTGQRDLPATTVVQAEPAVETDAGRTLR